MDVVSINGMASVETIKAALSKIATQADDAIDVAETALVLASFDHPTTDLQIYREHLKALAEAVNDAAAAADVDLDNPSPEDMAQTLTKVLAEEFRYVGDEDTRRKPAYHNGTAWTWTFPIFCEALAVAWKFDPTSVSAAKHYLVTMERLLNEGCLGQLPEITDGDAPHTQRGCDAQAWGASEALRVWKLLNEIHH